VKSYSISLVAADAYSDGDIDTLKDHSF